MAEEWRFIKGTRRYKVSDTGRVIDVETRKLLKINGNIVDIDGIDHDVRVVVYETFVGPIPLGAKIVRRNNKEAPGRYNVYPSEAWSASEKPEKPEAPKRNPDRRNLRDPEYRSRSREGRPNKVKKPKVEKVQPESYLLGKPIQGYKNLKRPIINTTTGKRYPSITDAASELGLKKAGISHVLNGRQKTAGGFVFKYVTEEKEETNAESLYR